MSPIATVPQKQKIQFLTQLYQLAEVMSGGRKLLKLINPTWINECQRLCIKFDLTTPSRKCLQLDTFRN